MCLYTDIYVCVRERKRKGERQRGIADGEKNKEGKRECN